MFISFRCDSFLNFHAVDCTLCWWNARQIDCLCRWFEWWEKRQASRTCFEITANFRNSSLYNSIFSCGPFFFCSSFATCLHLVKKQKTITKQFVLTTQTAFCLTEPDLKDKTWTVKLSPSSSSRSSSMLPLHQTKQTLGAPLFHIWITLPENHTAD